MSEAPEGAETELSPERVGKLLEGGEAQVIDVRLEQEYEAGHLASARHVELTDVPAKSETLDRERPVLLVCRGGNRSGMAAQALREAGFDAYNLAGGLSAWVEAGLPLEPESGRLADAVTLPPS